MSNIKITYPYLLYVAIPLAVLVIVGFFFIPKKKKKRPNNIISLVLHIVLAVTLSLAFADIKYEKTSNQTEVYVLVDCSVSEDQNVEKLDETVKDIYDKANASLASTGVICFGKESMVYVKPGSKYKSIKDVFDDTKYPDFARDSSDIASALTYTKELFDEGSIKKIILVSDGIETDNSAMDVIDSVLSDSISVDAVAINSILSDEVAVKSVDYVDHCYVNRQQNIKALVQSSSQKVATVQLLSGGEVKQEVEATLSKGLNVVTFTTTSDKVAEVEYEVVVKDTSDTYQENNSIRFTQDYTDKFNVLFIGNAEDDYKAFLSIDGYDDNVTISPYYDDSNVPYKLEDLLTYDEIVLSNVNLQLLNHSDDFANNLNIAVSTYGKSLITYGATYTTYNGQTSYIASYNDMLPVQYESDDEKALVLLIDCSGSMNTENRLETAKKGAIKCLDVLSDKDYVAILSFSDTVKVEQPLTSIKNKKEITKAINNISNAGGGTKMAPGLQAAEKQVLYSECEYKNVITLTDGIPSETKDTLRKIVKSMASDNIICSFINISSQSGQSLLENLATVGNGSYYFCNTAATLIDIMLSSVSSEIGNTEIKEEAEIQYRINNDPVMDGVNTLPDLQGYNYCRVKGGANTVLTVQYIKKDDNGDTIGVAAVPIYAYWTFGKGKVASFTSNLSNEWTSDFRSSTAGKTFLKNVIYESLPERSISTLMDFSSENNGYTTTVSITVGRSNGKVHIVSTAPETGEKEEVDLLYDNKTKSYRGKVNTSVLGKYSIEATYSEPDENGQYQVVETENFSFYRDYSKEYDMLPQTSDNILLNKLVNSSGGQIYENGDEYNYVRDDEELSHVTYQSTMMIFFLISVVIYLVDIFIRKTTFKNKKKPVDEY